MVDYPRDMSFIDRNGKKVCPNRRDYELMKSSRDHREAILLNDKYDSLISEYGKGSEEVRRFEKEELGMILD